VVTRYTSRSHNREVLNTLDIAKQKMPKIRPDARHLDTAPYLWRDLLTVRVQRPSECPELDRKSPHPAQRLTPRRSSLARFW
jgi:hypothetical protein